MLDKEDLRQQCESLSTEELFIVVHNRIRYTEQIVIAAQTEIRRRGLSKEEIDKHSARQVRRSKMVDGNITDDILTIEKILFFVLCLPKLNYFVMRHYRREKYVLKIKQARFYTATGLVTVLTLAMFWNRYPSLLAAAVLWMSSFMAAFLFDRYYNKNRVIRKLESLAIDPDDEESK